MKILGLQFPQSHTSDTFVALAIVSIPVALVAATGYGIFLGARAVSRRLHYEATEEKCRRMERVARLGSALEIEG